MKYLMMIILFLMSFIVLADEVTIELNPKKPVVGETFQAFFRIKTNLTEEPLINFSPFRLEVIGKNNYGVKTSSQWVNGKFSSTRELTVVYDLVASNPGFAGFRDITVTIGGKTLRHPSMNFDVLREPEVLPDVMVMADVPKKEIYLGEGIMVRYYLYTKTQITNLDVKKYPKLNGFSKRFLQEPERQERVSVNGVVYLRSLVYSSKLFAEKTGTLKIDPLHLSVTYLVNRGNDPFSSFGLNTQTRDKMLSSEDVQVTVLPLPENGKPEGFTGLVGKHEMRLDVNSTKFIVNQPMEFKLTVTGIGALENFDAPVLIKDSSLEEFEKNGDLKILDADRATKVFDYTYLPKENKIIPERNFDLSYFDPEQKKYISIPLNIPELKIAGAEAIQKKDSVAKPDNAPVIIPTAPTKDYLPTFKSLGLTNNFLTTMNLAIVGLFFMGFIVIGIKKAPFNAKNDSLIPKNLTKGQFQLSDFLTLLSPVISKTGKSPKEVLELLALSKECEEYFKEIISSYYQRSYLEGQNSFGFAYNKKFFKELDQKIKGFHHEDHSES